MISSTAILFFSRRAAAEAGCKSLLPLPADNQRLCAGLIQRTRLTLARTGLPTYWIDEGEQVGADFGERLLAAARSVVARGYERIIIVGNDCPRLETKNILLAASELDNHASVVGPDQRGGAYLIGLRAEWLTDGFAQLPWQTDRLADALQVFFGLQAEHTILLLRQSKDLKDGISLADLRCTLKGITEFSWLFTLSVGSYRTDWLEITTNDLIQFAPRRGPPVRA